MILLLGNCIIRYVCWAHHIWWTIWRRTQRFVRLHQSTLSTPETMPKLHSAKLFCPWGVWVLQSGQPRLLRSLSEGLQLPDEISGCFHTAQLCGDGQGQRQAGAAHQEHGQLLHVSSNLRENMHSQYEKGRFCAELCWPQCEGHQVLRHPGRHEGLHQLPDRQQAEEVAVQRLGETSRRPQLLKDLPDISCILFKITQLK